MATVQLKTMGHISRFLEQANQAIHIDEGITVKQLLDQLEIPCRYASLVILNDVLADQQSTLHEGDELMLSSIVGGA